MTLVTSQEHGRDWALYCGDSADTLQGLPSNSVDFTLYSPPFASLYVYSPSERDIGNSANDEQFFAHYAFIIREVLRVTKPGRLCGVHVQQGTSQLSKDGVIGLKDFRGDVIRAHQAEDWVFHGEVTIDKNPQAQAIRTKSKGLLFVQLRKDSSWLRPALADYVIVFRKPGENAVPIHPDLTNDEWITWAHPIWYGIKESDTLNVIQAREDQDERHICPLQLGTIERCVRLWSNPGELVLDPFNGIGSTGVVALHRGRHYVGIELKNSYARVAAKNLARAESESRAPTLFDALLDQEGTA